MIKVLYTLEDGRFGGINKMISEIAAQIHVYEVSPHLIVGKYGGSFFISKLSSGQVQFTVVDIQVLSKGIWAITKYLFLFVPDLVKLLYHIRKINPDIVYANGAQQFKSVIAAWILKKRIIWHLHDTYQPQLLIRLFLGIRALCGVKNYVASSERTSRFYSLLPSDTLVSLPPLILDNFKFTKRPLHVVNESPRLITVCNINPDKGLETLIRTIAVINKQKLGCLFQVVGLIPETQKAYFQSLLQLAKELHVTNLEFLGQRDDISELIASSDVYLCSSNNESGPIAVFEAMSIGLPVITTDVGDLRTLFEGYNCGIVKPVGDYNALAHAVIALLNNPDRRVEFAKNARQAVEENNSVLHFAEKQALLFQRLTDKK